ncbi:hypothetical protein EV121DRAFT_191791 [Schizophyllum commune]
MSQLPLYGDRPGVKITFAGAPLATVLRPMRYRCAGVDENSFNTPPPAFITALPFVRGKTIPYDRYTTFCREWFSEGAMVFYAEAARYDEATPRQRFALKVAFNVTGNGSPGGAFMESFRREAVFYNDHLVKLQGIAVPKHYGVWVGRTPWDTTIACAIMEWGGHPFDDRIVDAKIGKPGRSGKIMESIKAIHDAGIQHGDLIDDTFRHILYDTTCEKAFIIDFSTAERHKCPLIMRMRPYTTTPSRATFGCDELWDVATNVSYFGNGPCSGPGADPLVLQANAYSERQQQPMLKDTSPVLGQMLLILTDDISST